MSSDLHTTHIHLKYGNILKKKENGVCLSLLWFLEGFALTCVHVFYILSMKTAEELPQPAECFLGFFWLTPYSLDSEECLGGDDAQGGLRVL